jgi:hypothetical protein
MWYTVVGQDPPQIGMESNVELAKSTAAMMIERYATPIALNLFIPNSPLMTFFGILDEMRMCVKRSTRL